MTRSDLRKWLSPVRNQGSCGSCTSFGVIGSWEGCIRVKENNVDSTIDLSERDLFFCSGGGCSTGNYLDPVLNYAKDPGVCTEDCCPYDGVDHTCGEGRCSEWWTNGKKLSSWRTIISKDEMKSLLNTQPLVAVMEVHQSFINYKSGVYHSLGESDPVLGGHCISICGYDDDLGAWLLRNSWGTGWGMDGYCWIKYGDSGVDSYMYQLVPDGPIPPNPPTPSPCPVGRSVARLMNLLLGLLHRRGRFFYMNPS